MITVTPGTFVKVKFEAAQIINTVAELITQFDDLSDDLSIEIKVEEDQPTTRVAVGSLDPVVFLVDSGALENTRDPRSFGAEMTQNSIGRLLYEYCDRVSSTFGAPDIGQPVDLAQRIAWDTYCYGRLSRLDVRVYRPKHLYNFRNRLGFSDAADATFDRLWSADGLTWTDIVAECPSPD